MFKSVKASGATPTGERLDQILKPILLRLEAADIQDDGTPTRKGLKEVIKRVNLIVITDGEASKSAPELLRLNIAYHYLSSADDPKTPIIDAAERLAKLRNLCMIQVCRPLFRPTIIAKSLSGWNTVRPNRKRLGSDPSTKRARRRSAKESQYQSIYYFVRGAASSLTVLVQDIVDTTPYSKLNPVTADGLIKVLLGGINRRIDEQQLQPNPNPKQSG